MSDEIEIIEIKNSTKNFYTGVEIFPKLLDERCAGDHIGTLRY
nr:hypothetical protein [Candidatus Mikella endobia]